MMRHRPRSQAGVTLMEMTVVMAITTTLLLVAYSAIDEATITAMFVEQTNDLPVFTQSAVNKIQTSVFQARELFDSSGIGTDYASALALDANYPKITGTILPKFDPTGSFTTDATGTALTGNSLLLARQLPPLRVSVTAGKSVRVDLYRFEYFYLANMTTLNVGGKKIPRQFRGKGKYVDIMYAKSEAFADYNELRALGSADSDMVIAALNGTATVAWAPQQPIASAFFKLSGMAAGNPGTPTATPSITIASTTSLVPGMNGAKITGAMSYSVAFPGASTICAAAVAPPASTAKPDRSKCTSPKPMDGDVSYLEPVPLYAEGTFGSTYGFETKITGDAGQRQVLTRLVLYAHWHANRLNARGATVITATTAS
jgi:prepilin-type N-terminal cleavage/methylation domain-containing protein